VQGTGDQGQPLYQAYTILVDQNLPLSINTCCTTLAPDVGQSVAKNLFLTGGAAPYTWSVASGQLPPGLALQTFSDPRDANNELVGTPTTAGTYTFTMRVTDYQGDQATQQFTATINPPLQITSTMPAGTVGVPYSHDLTAQGGAPPYTWSIFANDPLPPGLSLGTTAPDFNNVLRISGRRPSPPGGQTAGARRLRPQPPALSAPAGARRRRTDKEHHGPVPGRPSGHPCPAAGPG
jgi:hypothetical protein